MAIVLIPAGAKQIVQSYSLTVILPDWQYFCLDLDTMNPKLDVYVGDKKLDIMTTGPWNTVSPQNLQLHRLSVNAEKIGLINFFSEPFRSGTCGQNGTLVPWSLILTKMRPMGINQADLAAVCGHLQHHLVAVPSRTNFETATQNCRKMGADGHFPVYSNKEAGNWSTNFL
jgi:hypothetical protein